MCVRSYRAYTDIYSVLVIRVRVACKILKRFRSGKFLIENRHGYIRAAIPVE